jgi:methionyl aminopeptidase
MGHQYEHKLIAQSSIKIFNEVSRYWKESKTTGHKLYEFASRRAQVLGFKLNLGNDGHRIGDFPHHVHFRGGLAECQEQVIPNAWILEIHLLAPQKNYGAFYEDVLSDIE